MSASLTELPVIACWPFEQGKSGFGLPVFLHPYNAAVMLVQEVDEISGKVAGFRKLEDTDLALVAISNSARAVIGDDIVYVFIDDDGSVTAGTSSDLSGILRRFSLRNPGRSAINLQIVELIGTEHEKKTARVGMRQAIIQQAGMNAATNFYSDTLRSILWKALLSAAGTEEIARRILKVRAQLNATVENGSLSFDLSAISQEDRNTINITSLAASILSEFDVSASIDVGPSSVADPLNPEVGVVQHRVTQVLHRISRCGRQEERMAILMDAIIADRKVGLSALLQYGRDRAKLANWTMDQLRTLFFQNQSELNDLKLFEENQNSQLEAEQLIAALVPRLFTQQYPLSRGELLFFLAKHLGKWPRVNPAIKRSLDRTASVFVDNWRQATDEALAQGKANSSNQ